MCELGCITLASFYIVERRVSKGAAQEKERPDADMHLKMESEKRKGRRPGEGAGVAQEKEEGKWKTIITTEKKNDPLFQPTQGPWTCNLHFKMSSEGE